MAIVVQSVTPKIEFFSYKDYKSYQVFSATSNNYSGQNLQSYTYTRAVNTFSGTFQISIRETSDFAVKENNVTFLDRVHTLDVVKISNDIEGKVDFVGVVTTISYTATESSKVINISGSSFEYLLEFFTIALDATAMAWANKYVNVEAKNAAYKSTDGGKDSATISSVIASSYNYFIAVATQCDKLSNIKIKDMISYFMGNGENFLENKSSLKFRYPIASNLLQNSTINWSNYIRNLLPQNVYELYGTIKNGVPRLRVREVPFSPVDWKGLKATKIKDYALIQYTLTKSIDEVYTNFYSYVEGSSLAPDFWNRLNSSTEGNTKSVTNEEKVKLYGYKPLQCNFIGYNTDSTVDITNSFGELNKLLEKWYSRLDEMYDATITVADIKGVENAEIGEKIQFLNGEFYVTGIEHSWTYNSTPKLTYHCERGGSYDSNGNFSELKGVSKPLAELDL